MVIFLSQCKLFALKTFKLNLRGGGVSPKTGLSPFLLCRSFP